MKKFINLCCKKDNFDTDSKWYFLAISHDIGAYGETVGTIKESMKTDTMLSRSLARHGVSSGCRWRRSLPNKGQQL
jgi:hypothetical protein